MLENRMIEMLNAYNDAHRFDLIEKYLEEDGTTYISDMDILGKVPVHNLYCIGDSSIYLVAHYDTVTIKHSANDNTASIINLLAIKKALPWLNIAFLDREEAPFLGAGSTRMVKRIVEGNIPFPTKIINLELTGRGTNWYVGTRGSPEMIESLSKETKITLIETPFSDTDRFLSAGLPSVVLFTVPDKDGVHDTELMYYCHTSKDTIENISISDMGTFITKMITYLIGLHNEK